MFGNSICFFFGKSADFISTPVSLHFLLCGDKSICIHVIHINMLVHKRNKSYDIKKCDNFASLDALRCYAVCCLATGEPKL